MKFEQLEADYVERLAAMRFTQELAARKEAQALLVHRDRFLAAQAKCGVPALWMMPVFYREGPSFDAYFGNGDPLDKPTTNVPKGRGPFKSWEDGVADALALDHVTMCPEWTWPRACYMFELWNGMGARMHGRPSGYLWSGTDQYHGGKYVADGVWSPGTFDHQLGTVIIAKHIAELDAQLAVEFKP